MRRIVVVTWGSYGDLYPSIGLSKALTARGCHVVLAAPAYYQTLAAREALSFHAVGPDVDPEDRARLERVLDPVRGTEAIVREWLMPAVRHSYEALQAIVQPTDLVVAHPVTFAAPVIADRLGIPWVSTVLSPISMFSAYDTPLVSGAPAWTSTLRAAGPWYGRLVRALARRATARWGDPVHELRRALGLRGRGHPLFEGQFSPHLTLALFSRVLAMPQPDWPSHVVQPGFVFYGGPDAPAPELDTFLAGDDPPVVFTLGSSAVGGEGAALFYDVSVRAARQAGVRAVLLTGLRPENQPRVAGPGLLVLPHAPHQWLFPRAAVVVHHGGVGTTAQALRAGRPMLIVPHANDQPDNADRVRRFGASRTLLPSRYTADRVAEELRQLLSDRRYRDAASRAAATVAAEPGAAGAADAIVTLAASG